MQDRNRIFKFKTECSQLTTILQPIAHACKCLEFLQATAADVYLFWLAVLTTYANLIAKNDDMDGLQLPKDVVKNVCKIVNSRYSEMNNGPAKGVYQAAFFLNPCMFVPLALIQSS